MSHADEILDALYDRVTVGGFILIDDYGEPECRRRVDEFRARTGITDVIERPDHRGGQWRKLETAHRCKRRARPHASRSSSPTTSRVTSRSRSSRSSTRLPHAHEPVIRRQLSVVVVFYNMKREAARTLAIAVAPYQQGIDDVDYEVVVVENGSDPDQRARSRVREGVRTGVPLHRHG